MRSSLFRNFGIGILFVFLMLSVVTTASADDIDVTFAGSYGSYYTSDTKDVAVSGNYAYVADGAGGLKIVDISEPTAPTLAGSCDTDNAYSVAVSGNYAYVADSSNDLVIVDISEPTTPALAGSYDVVGNVRDFAVSGNYAYLLNGTNMWTNSLAIVDISDPTAPTVVSKYSLGHFPSDVAISGNYAYVTDYSNGLVIIDISDPTAPTPAGGCHTNHYAHGVAVSGNYAYVGDEGAGLAIVDISDPTVPTLVGSHDTDGKAVGVAASGNYAYVADRANGLLIFDISEPTAPTVAGKYGNVGNVQNVAVSGSYLYVAGNYGGLSILQTAPSVSNNPPTATISSISPNPAFEGTSIRFDASGSYDPDGTIVSYDWDFGDGNTATGVSPTHTYASAGDYPVTLTVTDDDGATDVDQTTATVTYPVNTAPVANANGPYVGTPNTEIYFDAAGSHDPDGTIVSYEWDFGDGNTTTGAYTTHTYASAGDYPVTLTVTDDNGNTDRDETTATIASSIQHAPEFPTIALPIIAVLGLAFFFQRRKD